MTKKFNSHHQNLKNKIFSLLIVTLFFLINYFCFSINNANAHRPHHVVTQVRLSPNYQENQTLFIITRLNLFKSINGGKSWQRIVNGLDNKGKFKILSGNNKNNQVMYLSSYFDGIYKTEDGGNSWFKVNNGLNNLKVNQLNVAPNSENFVLVSEDDTNLYKTENGGNNWEKIFTTEAEITRILISNNQEKIFLGDANGNLYLSNDKGKNWQTITNLKEQNSGSINAISISSLGNDMWIGTEKKGIFKTNNNAESFTQINNGLTDQNITDLLVDESNNLYASTWDQGFFTSKDGGESWVKQDQGLEKDRQAEDLKLPNFNVLAKSGETIFLGAFDGLFKSNNLGQNWQSLETLSKDTVVSFDISPNYAKDKTLAIVTYVGNFYLSEDGGKTWNHLNKGLEIPRLNNSFELRDQHPRRFFDVAFSPNYSQDKTIFSALLWSKIAKSTTQAESWQIIPLPKEARGATLVPSPNFSSDKTIYVPNQQGYIFKSNNGGESFSTIAQIDKTFGNDPPSFIISPNFAQDKTLYSSTEKGIFKSIDAGKKWASITFKNELDNKYNIKLAISPNFAQDKTLFVGTNEGVFKSENGGDNWINLPIAELGNNAYLEGVAVSPNYQNDQTIVVSVRGKGLYKSENGGQNFQSIGDRNLPASRMNEVPSAGIPIKFSPNYTNDNTMYSFGGATTEVFKSTDGGNTWEVLSVPINPISENEKYDLPTTIDVGFYIYKGKIFRILAAVFIGLATYLLVGFLNLEKKIPLSKIQIKMISSFAIFVLSFLVLYKI